MATLHHPVLIQPSPVQFRNITVFTDLSFVSKLALRYAAVFARQFGAKISLVNSVPIAVPSLGAVDVPVIYMPAIEETESRLRSKQLTEELERSWMRGLDAESVVCRFGLKDYLRDQQDVDMVVLGTSGKRGAEKMLFGSTAEEIFRWSRVPVLTIGPSCRWPEGKAIQRVLYVTDFSPKAEKAFDHALVIAAQFSAELMMLHVVESGGSQTERTMALVDPMERLQTMVPDLLRLTHKPHLLVSFGVAAETIPEEASRWQADLIVMGARGASAMSHPISHFAGGVAYKVAAQGHCPVLTVRH